MVAWTRNRVVNFSESFATRYVRVLVELDGQPYDQPLFFKFLADAGVVRDVSQGATEEETEERRSKRWDSYLGKIREFGLGFAVEERRKGGPTRTVWRASDVSKAFVSGSLNYRQFMALQMMRFQLPRPAMPIQGAQRDELLVGVRVRPLGLVLEVISELRRCDRQAYLSRTELFGTLTRVESHSELEKAVEEIIAAREERRIRDSMGDYEEDAVDAEAGASEDIWLNEFEATGYLSQLKPTVGSGLPEHIVVPVHERWDEALSLNDVIPLQAYDESPASINAFFDFFTSAPSREEREILQMSVRVVQLDVPAEAEFDEESGVLEGRVELLGGLVEGTRVVLVGDGLNPRTLATVFEVTAAESRPAGVRTTVVVRPVMVRVDEAPLNLGG